MGGGSATKGERLVVGKPNILSVKFADGHRQGDFLVEGFKVLKFPGDMWGLWDGDPGRARAA